MLSTHISVDLEMFQLFSFNRFLEVKTVILVEKKQQILFAALEISRYSIIEKLSSMTHPDMIYNRKYLVQIYITYSNSIS